MDISLSVEELNNIVEHYDILTYNFVGEIFLFGIFTEISEYPLTIIRYMDDPDFVLAFNRISNIQLKLSIKGQGGWIAFMENGHVISQEVIDGLFERNINIHSNKYDIAMLKRQWTIKQITNAE